VTVAGTPTVNATQSGAWNVSISGTPKVTSGDVAAVIASGTITIPPNGDVSFPNSDDTDTDVSAYREVTLYLELITGTPANIQCDTGYFPPGGGLFALENPFTLSETGIDLPHHYAPAPPGMVIQCINNDASFTAIIKYSLVGRAN
jgi:hypothetical protein